MVWRLGGISPVSWLLLRPSCLRFDSLERKAGMVPERLLWLRERDDSLDSLASSGGIPDISFTERPSPRRWLR